MKNRVRRIVNFFAFNLLFFALYLNFIYKEKVSITEQPVHAKQVDVTRTGLAKNPSKDFQQGAATNV